MEYSENIGLLPSFYKATSEYDEELRERLCSACGLPFNKMDCNCVVSDTLNFNKSEYIKSKDYWKSLGFDIENPKDDPKIREYLESLCTKKKGRKKLDIYWYLIGWSYNDYSYDELKKNNNDLILQNINKLLNRDKYFKFVYVDYVLETGTINDREHYHMRVKCKHPMQFNDLKNYKKYGHIDFKRMTQTEESWNQTQKYVTKENQPIIAIDRTGG